MGYADAAGRGLTLYAIALGPIFILENTFIYRLLTQMYSSFFDVTPN